MKSNSTRLIFLAYFITLHLTVVYSLYRSNRVQSYLSNAGVVETPTPVPISVLSKSTREILASADKNLPKGEIVFLGDSLTQTLPVQTIATNAVNYGIAGDTSEGLAKRLDDYSSLETARAIVLQIGTNDALNQTDDFTEVAGKLPKTPKIYWYAVPPVDKHIESARNPAYIKQMNLKIQSLCSSLPNCTFIDLTDRYTDAQGNLKKNYHVGDGVHFSAEGYRIWIESIKQSGLV